MQTDPLTSCLWARELKASIVVCDRDGIVLEMNEAAAVVFEKWGGKALVGKNLLDCHPEPAKSKLLALMEQQATNVYTIEKNGVKKFLYQTPWYDQGIYAGFVEIAFTLPEEVRHFIRQ